MTTDHPQESILSSPGRNRGTPPDNYDPLGTCPAPLKYAYLKMAIRAREGQLAPAARLKCLECCAWQKAEVAKCHINECALYARNMRERERNDKK